MNQTSRAGRIAPKVAAAALGAILTAGTLALAAAPVFAAGNTIYINPAATTTSAGSTITVKIDGDSGSQLVSGVGASIQWDKTKLNLQSIVKGADWLNMSVGGTPFPAAFAGVPSSYTSANSNGFINGMAAHFEPDVTDPLNPIYPALSGNHTFLTFNFVVLSGWTGDSPITLTPSTGNDTFLDGTPATYGDGLTSVQTQGTVSIPAPTATPVPTATPTLAPANGTVNVTGTLSAGFLSLQCPTAVSIPLVRNSTNTKDVVCSIYSDGTWNLMVNDPKGPPNTGHMTDGAKHLTDAMHAVNGATDVNLETGGTIASGSNSVSQTTTLSQFVGGTDQPGNYAISLVFQAISGF